jgi:hypothetical protein
VQVFCQGWGIDSIPLLKAEKIQIRVLRIEKSSSTIKSMVFIFALKIFEFVMKKLLTFIRQKA